MKKFIIILAPILVIAIPASIAWFIFSGRMLVRKPVLVARNPVVYFSFGDVTRSTDRTMWEKVTVGMKLDNNSFIKTGADSKVDIWFNEGMVIRVAAGSLIDISKFNMKEKVILLDSGAIYGFFKREHEDQTIKIITPTTVASVRGTELGFELLELENESGGIEDATAVYTMSGIVEIRGTNEREDGILLANQMKTVVRRGKPPENPVKIEPEKFEELQNILNSIHMNEVIVISEKILFDTNRADIKKQSYTELDRIAKLLQDRTETIRIEGHTDDTGTAFVNQRLSTDRAESIKKYLISKGVPDNRLTVAGYGSSRPVVPNTTEENKSVNRRVEFTIVK